MKARRRSDDRSLPPEDDTGPGHDAMAVRAGPALVGRLGDAIRRLVSPNRCLGRSARAGQGRTETGDPSPAACVRNGVVGRLASGLVHLVNDPLAIVSMNVTFVREGLEGPWSERQAEEWLVALREAEESLARIRGLTARLGRFVRDPAPVGEGGRVGDAIEEALGLAPLLTGPRVAVRRDVAASLPEVRADPERLICLLVVLLAHAGGAGGQPFGEPRQIVIVARAVAGAVTITIEAPGPGGVPRGQARACARSVPESRCYLRVAKDFVGRLGGSLEVVAPGAGELRFTLTLPAGDAIP